VDEHVVDHKIYPAQYISQKFFIEGNNDRKGEAGKLTKNKINIKYNYEVILG
jgi:hypothetical protein